MSQLPVIPCSRAKLIEMIADQLSAHLKKARDDTYKADLRRRIRVRGTGGGAWEAEIAGMTNFEQQGLANINGFLHHAFTLDEVSNN
jgi:hypothetical protein